MDINETQNLKEIADLSQRGQTLSIVDLMAAHTLTAEMAAYALTLMRYGASALTAARPGNAGKTTLLACLLTGIPSGARIRTVSSGSMLFMLDEQPEIPEVLLVHEIGAGPWYGYLWGPHVPRAFELIGPNRSLASCIHADTLDELTAILTSPELGVPASHLRRLDLICFLHLDREGFHYRRRVARIYEAFGNATEHRPLFRWNSRDDTFEKLDDTSLLDRLAEAANRSPDLLRKEIERSQKFLELLQHRRVTDFRQVRSEILRFYQDHSMGAPH